MTKSRYVKYQCDLCSAPCRYFYELKEGKNEFLYPLPMNCITGQRIIPKWKRVDRFTKNGI